MSVHYLYTTDIAYAVAIHPNTVRMYEEWNVLPPVPRSTSGYRLFTEDHLDQMRLVRSTMHFTWLGGDIRRMAYKMMRQAATGDLGGALERAYHILVQIRSERTQAEAAAALLERWAKGTATDATAKPLRIGQVAKLLDVTNDMLRNWELDGLVKIPRDPHNGYRVYGPEQIGRLRVIRMLRHARYSTMAILRMLTQLDQGRRNGLRQVLDTPAPDEDIGYATDRWLSSLAELEPRSEDLIAQLERMIQKHTVDAPPIGSEPARSHLLKLQGAMSGGREIVARQFAETLATVLDRIVPIIDTGYCDRSDYRLAGTTAALLQGVFLPVRDINLLVRTRAQVDACAVAMTEFPCPTPPSYRDEDQLYLTTYLVRGFEITIATNERSPDVQECATSDPGPWEHYVYISCGAYQVPAVMLELCLALELHRNRPARYRPLIRHLQRHGYDLALLLRAMEAHVLPEALQQKVLAQLGGEI
ncbi:MAG: MerR family transcriptional regulator [Anaerolineae bacterium]|nr:MerR family transcriptional regulator [Anaerolineae bacterium]